MQIFNFLQEHILENDAVRLNPLHHQDIDKLLRFSEQQPELWKYSLQPADGLKNLKTYVDLALNGRKEETSYPFIVFDKRTQQIAGSTRFYDFQKNHNTVQLGYTWYGKEFQGSGINKQCKMLLLEFAFEKLGIDRVEFRADANNARSIAAMKSIGCTVEGILRSNCAAPNGRRDSIVLSILKDEWFGGVKETLKSKIEKEGNVSPQ
ncbi:GNAT family N-acetyltransferase [Aequorivita antarctica]|uniref:GNAT family N-acetyltransferase n=1 Tax=Aequorivita antarctica TaxID=153266 RepID=A0A5C6YXN1_9FLAO|nr:GNAT family protein [Aequorivita antarctica]TXD71878.1 GNAT family N-acetyltransferase [Aequorivita antarctica]SRX75458.1 Putative ribosomal N-acetyltransferase YdaF [Aequorivita antarctica]